MNVTSKGYYTSNYLNNITRNRQVGLPDNERKQYDYFSRPLNRPHSPRTATAVTGDYSPNSARSRTPVARSRTPLSRPRTPSQMNDAKGGSVPGSPLSSSGVESFGENAGKVSDLNSGSKEEAIYDPDYLEQEITPAELNILQNKNSRHYSNKVPRDKALINGKVVRKTLQYPQGDYYIKQKQRYNESPYKPKFYTHKTFREVFEDEQELLEKYNPMESVFDDPEAKREQEQSQRFKRAFKTIQNKLGKDNYNDYDYYKNKNMSSNDKRDVFINAAGTSSANDDDDENDLNNKIYLTEEEKKQFKKNKNFKNVWRRKLKKASKELCKDYSNNLDYLNGRIENISTAEPIVLEPEESKDIGNASTSPSANAEFHPLWNYILSWLVYDQTETPAYKEEPVVNNNLRSKMIMNKDNVKFDFRNIKKNYQGVVDKWGQPASALFNNGQIPQNQKSLMRRLGGGPVFSAPPGLLDDLSQEFIIEVDDADDEESYLEEELYYDPSSRQLQRNPPTSFSSLYTQTRFNKQRRNSILESSKGPVAIISNLNTLIKNIKIMRIIFAPIDIIAMNFPNLQTLVIMIELVIFLWLLYELSLLIDALCMMVKAVCAPMIAMGRFMNRIM